jgi:hypothetical protein
VTRRAATGCPPGGGPSRPRARRGPSRPQARRRRAGALIALLGVLVLGLLPVAPGLGKTSAPPVPELPAPSVTAPLASLAGDWRAAAARVAERLRVQRERSARLRDLAERRAGLRALRGTRTVPGAVRRALLAGRLDAPTAARLRRTWWLAQRDLVRLRGLRRAELGAAMRVAAGLARSRRLTAQRIVPVLLTVQRNREFWTTRPLPRPGARRSFGRDPVVFEYYAGQGWAIQPLASFGKANALAASCLQAQPRWTCRRVALRRLLDRMVSLGVVRRGVLAWEHHFAFGGGRPGWISAMTQATGAQALARGRWALLERSYGLAARRALRALQEAPPYGVAVRAPGGRRYTMYSFSPSLRILNGELQALIGVRDASKLLGSRSARRLYERGEPAARRAVRSFDTGAWSLYSQHGRESTPAYHRLLTGFLRGLCRRTHRGAYCAAATRFARYEREAPRILMRVARRGRVRHALPIVFSLSKVSRVRVVVWGRGGIVVHRRLRLPRGRHAVAWVPRRAQRYRVLVDAVGPGGTRGAERRTVVVRRPPAGHPRHPRRRR